MNRISPLAWISFGLVSMTISFMLTGDWLLNLVPDKSTQVYEYREKLSEALAVQYSILVQQGNLENIDASMEAMVARNEDVLSAALRTAEGHLLVVTSDHEKIWVQPSSDRSTLSFIQVPIFDGDAPWGTLQISFRPQRNDGVWWFVNHPWFQFVAFVGLAGFLGFRLFMKKTLRQLDPSEVVPKRVKAALDILQEGVIFLDKRGHIVLANTAFANHVGQSSSSLIGSSISKLPWRTSDNEEPIASFPWTTVMKEKKSEQGAPLLLAEPTGEPKKFIVNSTPILDERGAVRGVLSSFSDVSELEHANAHLLGVLKELVESREEVSRKNEELERLATRDPLTGCFNRRAFFDQMEQVFVAAQKHNTDLGCIMADIDHFKSFNDRYGHTIGDQVIQVVAKALGATLRATDFLGRYGGEEFCIIMPGLDSAGTAKVAERIRAKIELEAGLAIRTTSGIQITSSFGVSSIASGAIDPSELIDQADKALYRAKEGGRNRVMEWGQINSPEDYENIEATQMALSHEPSA